MTSLSLKNYTHVLLFKDRAHKFITQQQYEFVFSPEVSKQGFVHTPSLGYFDLKQIARVLEANEYYEQFPDKRTQYTNYSEPSKLPVYEERTPDQHREYWKNGMQRILAGLQEHIDQHGPECRAITPEQLAKNKFKIFA